MYTKIANDSVLQKQHEGKLRPALGHPKNREELEELKNVEKERSDLRMKALKDFMAELKVVRRTLIV